MDMVFWLELKVFCLCGICGVACGVLYDMFRIVRRVFKIGAVGIFLLDILFWIMCAVITFCMLYVVNYGRIRWYEWLGIAVGAGSYFLSASPMVTEGGTAFLSLIIKIMKIAFSPVLFAVRRLISIFGRIKGKISKKIAKNRLTMGSFWFRIKKRVAFYKNYLKR